MASVRAAYFDDRTELGSRPAYVFLDSKTDVSRLLQLGRQTTGRTITVLFNGAMSFDKETSTELLERLVDRGGFRVAVLWHETGVGLRILAGVPQRHARASAEVLKRRQERFRRLYPLLSRGNVRHLAVSGAVRQAVSSYVDVDPHKIPVVWECLAPVSFQNPALAPRPVRRFAGAGVADARKRLDVFSRLAKETGSRGTRWVWFGATQHAGDLSPATAGGYVEDLTASLRQFDAYVCPSVDEPMSVAALQALACGLPVVCMQGTGMAELIPPQFVASSYRALRDIVLALVDDDLCPDRPYLHRLAASVARATDWRERVGSALQVSGRAE